MLDPAFGFTRPQPDPRPATHPPDVLASSAPRGLGNSPGIERFGFTNPVLIIDEHDITELMTEVLGRVSSCCLSRGASDAILFVGPADRGRGC